MPSYRVVWEIDVEADTPVEAAAMARNAQVSPDTTANVFDVHEGEGASWRIDLQAVEEGLDLCRGCGQDYPQGGDGYNGRCPDCADRAETEGRAVY